MQNVAHALWITAQLTDKIYHQKLGVDYNPSNQQYTKHTKTGFDKKRMLNDKIFVMNY